MLSFVLHGSWVLRELVSSFREMANYYNTFVISIQMHTKVLLISLYTLHITQVMFM